LQLYLSNIASNENDNNSDRILIKNIDGRIITSDDPINIRRRIMKIMEIGKLPKEINLTTFYTSNKDKIMVKNKLKKIKKKAQFLAIINQPTAKKRKIITANINSKSKN
jgi:uncharacterized Ntn-hydrolase superfamily protein